MNPIEIALLTYNRLEWVQTCLSSIIAFTDYPYRLIIFDNGSTDGTLEYLRLLKEKGFIYELIESKVNLGIAEPKNIILKKLEWTSDYFVLTDSDIVFPFTSPSWINQQVALLNKYPQLGFCALNFDATNVPDDTRWWFGKQLEAHRLKGDDLILLESGFWGTMITKKAIEDVRGYNQLMGVNEVFRCRSLYGETDEMFRQAIKATDNWFGVARQIKGINLGWSDPKKFVNYHMFKKIERSKAEKLRYQEKQK